MPKTHPPIFVYQKNYKISYDEAELNAIKTCDYKTAGRSTAVTQFFNRSVLQPAVGKLCEQRVNKEETARTIAIRSVSAIGAALSATISVASAPITLLTGYLNQRSQTPLAYICPDLLAAEKPAFTSESPIHIFHMNMGMGPDYKNSIDGLTSAKSRAEQFIAWVDAHKMHGLEKALPEIMLLQEVFDKGAEKIICEKLKKNYPYIIYNVAPHFLNMGSGQMILSQYPLGSVSFEVFNHMPFPDNITAPRGILKSTIKTKQGSLELFNIHTAPLLSKKRCAARKANMEQIFAATKESRQGYYEQAPDKGTNPEPLFQVICGDTNLQYPYDTWNQELSPDHPEYAAFEFTEQHFRNIRNETHTAEGRRKEGTRPSFLEVDRQLTQIPTLTESPGSWFAGTYITKDGGPKGPAEKLTANLPMTGKRLPKPGVADKWNTPDFPTFQNRTCSAALDLTLIPKPDENEHEHAKKDSAATQAFFEIRNMELKDAISGMSDHKGCSALVFTNLLLKK